MFYFDHSIITYKYEISAWKCSQKRYLKSTGNQTKQHRKQKVHTTKFNKT